MRKLFLLVSFLAISGCATSQVNSADAKKVPAERVLYKGSGPSLITITRDSGWMVGGGCYVMTTIDGKDVARIDTAETVTINVSEGRHILGFKGDRLGNGLCAVGSDKPFKESSTDIASGEHQYFRISGDTNSGLDIRPTSSM